MKSVLFPKKLFHLKCPETENEQEQEHISLQPTKQKDSKNKREKEKTNWMDDNRKQFTKWVTSSLQ